MYTVYIIKSIAVDRYYIGHSSNMHDRLLRHNNGQVKSTKAYMPWQLIYGEILPTKQLAYAREMVIKSYKHGEAFKKLIMHKTEGWQNG